MEVVSSHIFSRACSTYNLPNQCQLVISLCCSFGSLFSSSTDSRTNASTVPLGYVHYNAPTHQISPALETMRKRHINDRRRGFDYFDPNDV